MKINLIKTLSGFSPADDDAMKYHRKFNIGDIYHMDVTRFKNQRNRKLLAKYWVMLREVLKHQNCYRTDKDLHHDIKWALDITEVHQNVMTGEMIKKVGSVAIDKMEDDEFNKFYSDAITVIIEKVIVGTDRNDLINHVDQILRFA